MSSRVTSRLVGIIERILPKKILKRYDLFLYSAGISFKASEYLLISFLVAVIVGTSLFIFKTLYGILGFIGALIGAVFGYPYWRIVKRIENMEQMIPDAFFYLASSLRAGISFSEALEELTTAKFGALTEEFKKTVAEIKKGRPTVEALKAFALRNKKSPVIYRSMMIIIEALERGAPMADVLVSVGNDVREILRIKKERKASTGMQTMFFIIASGFVGPLILGVVSQVIAGLSGVEGTVILPIPAIKSILLVFVALQAIVSGMGIGVIREGKFSGGLKYSVMLAIMGVIVFNLAGSISLGI
ncbi:type II secretion system F family protein [Thermococcus sp. M39]|uniref:type II secretion system F family protein n=1 Tax=unclassified Thermococcus TaxID=2627626 RepID=UPI00143C383C|nr:MULTISPECIES: type II secretion system F family protein [unclassified Thermococcus]NJE08419.1 type II secretion system F family protein [Thermococcus sp. M39]NJE11921.1 type II secretion system F family protein [Thermococcus sp. LS2]